MPEGDHGFSIVLAHGDDCDECRIFYLRTLRLISGKGFTDDMPNEDELEEALLDVYRRIQKAFKTGE